MRSIGFLAAGIAAVGALAGTGSIARAQAEPPTDDELAALAAQFSCPSITGLEIDRVDASVTDAERRVTCRYGDGSAGAASVTVTWQEPDVTDAYLCTRVSSTTDDEQYSNVRGTVKIDGIAVVGDFDFLRDRAVAPIADFERAARELAVQAADRAQPCAPPIGCTPVVGGMGVTFDADADVTPEGGTWRVNCWWSPGSEVGEIPDDESGSWSDVVMNITYATDNQDGSGVTTICSAEPFDRDGIVIIPGDGLAVSARIDFRNPSRRFPKDEMLGEARRIMDEVAPLARSCDGVERIPPSSYFSPLPAWFGIDPALAAGTPPIDIDLSGTGRGVVDPTNAEPPTVTSPPGEAGDGGGGTPATEVVGDDSVEPGVPGAPGSGRGTISTALRVVGIVMLIASLALVALSIVLVGKESRLRPVLDAARIVVMGVVVVVMTLVFSVETPVWAFALAAVLGLGIGLVQGRHLAVRVGDRGIYVRRTAVAAGAFMVALAITQIAGYANRSGTIQLGLALSVLSVAIAAGLMIGRHPEIARVRSLGAVATIVLMITPALAMLAVAVPRANAQDAPGDDELQQVFVDMVDWSTVELRGGFGAGPDKPPVPVPSTDGLDTPPDDVAADVTWDVERSDGTMTYDLTETYSFALGTDGRCCAVTYAFEGTTSLVRDGADTIVESVSGTAPAIELVVGAANRGPMPFGQATLFGEECERTVAGPTEPGVVELATFTVDGQPRTQVADTPMFWIPCDVPGFTVDAALAAAPSPPPAGDPARNGGFGGAATNCPVYQEVVAAVVDPTFEGGRMNPEQLGRLFVEPNAAACSGAVHLGRDARGDRRSELDFELASNDPASEGFRRWDSLDGLLLQRALHEIDPADRCVVGEDGIPRDPEGAESCFHRSYHQVADGVITIWVDTAVGDGPNTEVRGVFPWGSYRYRCHHCEPGDPEITRVIDAWHEFGTDAVAGIAADTATADTGPADTVATDESTGDGREATGGGDDDLVDLFTDEGSTSEERAAVAAALAGLLGAAGLAGISLSESGGRAGDADRADPSVVDEHGRVLTADDEGLFDWETPDGVERLDRETVLERIAAARDAERSRDARIDEIVAEQWDDDAARSRFDDMRGRSLADDERARTELADHLAHEAAQDETRRRVADMLHERAETGGWDAIADRLEQGASLTREDLQAIRDALDRLTAEQGAVDPASVGSYAEDLWDEFAKDAATGQEALAQVLERTHGPAAAWIARNPAATARIALGVATGGFSEGVIAPWEMLDAMERAAAEAHAQGRDLTYGEAMAAAAWQAGPGMLMGKVAEVGMSALGPAVVRWGGEALDAMGRSVDELFDGLRGGLADGTDVVVREGSEVFAESLARQEARVATRTVRGSAELADAHGLRWNPTDAADGVRSLEAGTIVPQARISEDYGMSESGYRQLRGTAQRRDVTIKVRSRSRGALERIEAGATPKPQPVKVKSGGEIDTYIGMSPNEVDHVPWKPDGDWIKPTPDAPPPNWPTDRPWTDVEFQGVNARYEQRMQEFADNKSTIDRLIGEGRARHDPETGNLEWNLTGGRRTDPSDFRPIAGDHDLFDIEVNVPAEVRAMGPDEVERYVRQVQQEVVDDLSGPPLHVQHPAHMQWKVPDARQPQEINARILDSHRPPVPGNEGDALLTVAKDMPAHITYHTAPSFTLAEVRGIYPD